VFRQSCPIAVRVPLKYSNTFDRNNAIFVFLMGALPAIAGSAISFLLGTAFVWGLVSLALRRFEFRLTRGDLVICWTFTAFAALILATALIGTNRANIPASTYWLLAFLSPWVVIPRMRSSPDVDYLNHFIVGAGFGAIGGMLVGFVESVGFGHRPAGGAGNAAVYAMMCLCLAIVAGLNINHPERRLRYLAVAGVAAGLVAVVLSLTRGVAMAAPPALLLLLAYAPRAWRFSTRFAIVILALVVAALYAPADLLQLRALETIHEVERVLAGGSSENIGERLRLWAAGVKAIADSPIIGHGIQNRMLRVEEYLVGDGLPIMGFTHAHNAFISFMLDGGVLVLAGLLCMIAAPTYVAWSAAYGPNSRKRVFLAAEVALIYSLCGLSQIMFKHDIMDSFFIFVAILIAVSVREQRDCRSALTA
jgi:O-antigen ligase